VRGEEGNVRVSWSTVTEEADELFAVSAGHVIERDGKETRIQLEELVHLPLQNESQKFE
jgi:hypothetical protein